MYGLPSAPQTGLWMGGQMQKPGGLRDCDSRGNVDNSDPDDDGNRSDSDSTTERWRRRPGPLIVVWSGAQV